LDLWLVEHSLRAETGLGFRHVSLWEGIMKTRLLIGAALLAILSSPLAAADLSRPAPAPAPVYTKAPPPMVFSWTGFYIGGNLGGHWGRDNTTTAADPVGWLAVGAATINATTPGTVNPSGFEGGGQVGYNVQYGSAVFGLEADAEYMGGTAARAVTGFGAGVAAADVFTTSTQPRWIATFRGRLGIAMDRALLYATGGGAFSGVSTTDTFCSFSCPAGVAADFASVTNNSGVWGWTVGGGIEWAITNNWIGRAEYLYVAFPTFTNSIPSCAACAVGSDISVSHKYTENIGRVGLSYKLY
jgi:outer membrane immunogenic protein